MERMTLRIPKEKLRAVEVIAEAEGTTMSEVIRESVSTQIDEEKDNERVTYEAVNSYLIDEIDFDLLSRVVDEETAQRARETKENQEDIR
jgi:metal-responsive CopG/Arc/MetJ family transcriptional regulator